MATKQFYERSEVKKGTYFSNIKAIVETPFYGNNVYPVQTPSEAYKLAEESPGTIVTDMPIYKPEAVGLPEGATALIFNDGAVQGRCAAARRVIGEPGVDAEELGKVVRDAVYDTRFKTMLKADAYVGLSPEFMVKAHLLIPDTEANILLSWMLNFQYCNEFYNEMYEKSKVIDGEADIYVFSDPTWSHPDFPLGLALFDPEHNCAAILGMRYFGEHKKGTLTLAWGIANRHGFCSCHGGQKRYNLPDGRTFVAGVFGLSGSGKSTITHEKHGGKYGDITVLHDDAFVISNEGGNTYSVALEPAYFDKTNDYPTDHPDNKFLMTVQNVGCTLDKDGKKVIVPEDIRNGNGRAVKSRLWSPNRVDLFEESVNAVIWLMKDPTLPPLIKIDDPVVAASMGATLATKRTTAERLAPGVDPDALVVEPYANPFRTYPLSDDYAGFKKLFEGEHKADCYIINTGFFGEKKVPKEVTFECLEAIIEQRAEFKRFGKVDALKYMPIEGFEPDFDDVLYAKSVQARMNNRVEFIESKIHLKGGYDKLPDEALEAMKKIAKQAAEK